MIFKKFFFSFLACATHADGFTANMQRTCCTKQLAAVECCYMLRCRSACLCSHGTMRSSFTEAVSLHARLCGI